MRKIGIVAAATIISLASPFLAQGAAKAITQTPMTLITRLSQSDPSVNMVVRGKAIYLIGTQTGALGTDGFVQSIDAAGTIRWSLPLGNGSSEIATATAFDSAGNLWVAGSAQTPNAPPSPVSMPSATPSTTPSATASGSPTPSSPSTPTSSVSPPATILNPDAITLDPSIPMRKDLTSLILWKVSAAGVLLATYTAELSAPILVNGATFANKMIAIVGIISTSTGHAGFLLQSDVNGSIGGPVIIGKTETELNAVVKKSDGSLVLLGSSSETIAKQSRKGVKDAIMVLFTTAGNIASVIRSSNVASSRSWQSGTNSFFLGGAATAIGKREAVVTKFSSTFLPTWTLRFASSGAALNADSSTSHFLLFPSVGPIAGIKGWKPSKAAALTVALDSKGGLIGAYGAISITTPMAIGYSRDLGIVVLGRGPAGVSIFHALPR